MDQAGYREYHLKPGFIFFTIDPTVILSVLGTSVAVTLFDKKGAIGGMNHFVYPWMKPEVQPTALYARPAMVQLVRMFRNTGTDLDHLEAHIIGGAVPEDASDEMREMAQNNIEAATRLLEHYAIPISGQEVGGRHGRKVLFNTGTGELVIAKVDKIRKSDWYPMDPALRRPEEE
jgi:chemotaxis protein CheD